MSKNVIPEINVHNNNNTIDGSKRAIQLSKNSDKLLKTLDPTKLNVMNHPITKTALM